MHKDKRNYVHHSFVATHKPGKCAMGRLLFFFFVETDGLGVTSTSNSPLTIQIQRGHFMKKNGNSVYLLNEVVRGPICAIWDNKRVVQHVHKH